MKLDKQEIFSDLMNLLGTANALTIHVDGSEEYKEADGVIQDLNIKYLVERGETL